MQKELAHARKTLVKTERELEQYRLHLQEVQKNVQRKHLDEEVQRELESLRNSVATKEHELERLRQQASVTTQKEEEAEKLRGDVEDLEADLREKDRLIEDRDDEIDRLKEKASKYSEDLAQMQDQLEDERRRLEDLEENEDEKHKLSEQLQETQEDLKEALEAKQKAEEDLEEVSVRQAVTESRRLILHSCKMRCPISQCTPKVSAASSKTRQTNSKMIWRSSAPITTSCRLDAMIHQES